MTIVYNKVSGESFILMSAHENSVPGDLLKLLYLYMLDNFSFSEIMQFWENHICQINDSRVGGTDLLKHLWDEDSNFSEEYQYQVLSCFIKQCKARAQESDRELERLLLNYYGGVPVRAERLLSLVAPFAEKLYFSTDIYPDLLVSVATQLIHITFPELQLKLIKIRYTLPSHEAYMSIERKAGGIGEEAEHLAFICLVLKLFPVRLGLPAMREVRVISDVTDVAFGSSSKRVGQNLAVYEEIKEMSQYLSAKSATFIRIKYSYVPAEKRADLLSSVIEDCTVASPLNQQITQKHQNLLDFALQRCCYVFKREEGKLLRDGLVIARGATALILSKIMNIFFEEKRCDFEHREFLRDPEIITNPSNPNFVVRLRRVFDAVESRVPEFSLEKSARGSFRMIIRSKFTYSEE